MTRQPAACASGPALPAQLAATLVASGVLRSARWISAFQAVPRHVFVPRIYVDRGRNGAYELLDSGDPARRPEWLSSVYADEPVVTKLDGDVWLSSSSQPSLMAEMLEALAVTGPERVLEIGTGTGYNAALLAEGIGSAQVASIDVDTQLVTAARHGCTASATPPSWPPPTPLKVIPAPPRTTGSSPPAPCPASQTPGSGRPPRAASSWPTSTATSAAALSRC